jgi:hypothetical protein
MGANNGAEVCKRRFSRLAMAVNSEYYNVPTSRQVQGDKRWLRHSP